MFNKLLFLGVFVVVFSGCASNKNISYVYDESSSLALNIAKAGGINEGLKDAKVPQDKTKVSSKLTSVEGVMVGQGYATPLPGMTGNASLGLGLASLMFSPSPKAEKNTLLAWMPEVDGEPTEELSQIIIKATEAAAVERGYKTNVHISKQKKSTGIAIGLYGNSELGECSENGNKTKLCWISFGIALPEAAQQTPSFVGSENSSWFFGVTKAGQSGFKFNWWNENFNGLAFVAAVSKHLPEWVFLYAAPKKVIVDKDNKLEIPIVLNKGEVHNFVRPNQG